MHLALLPHRDAHIADLLAATAVVAFVGVELEIVETSMIEQPEGRAVRTQITAVETIADHGRDEESAEVSQADECIETADEAHRPGAGRILGDDHHADVIDEEEPFAVAQPPSPLAAHSAVAKRKADGLAHAHAGTVETADHPPTEQEHRGQDQKERDRARHMQ